MQLSSIRCRHQADLRWTVCHVSLELLFYAPNPLCLPAINDTDGWETKPCSSLNFRRKLGSATHSFSHFALANQFQSLVAILDWAELILRQTTGARSTVLAQLTPVFKNRQLQWHEEQNCNAKYPRNLLSLHLTELTWQLRLKVVESRRIWPT